MDLYREEILEHWQNPQNWGSLDSADLESEVINPLCGDRLKFFFKFSRGPVTSFPPASARLRMKTKVNGQSNGKLRAVGTLSTGATPRMIKDVRFTGSGCAISIASASILSENIKNKKLSWVKSLKGEDVLKMIGSGKDGFPPARLKCAFLALEAVKKLGSSMDR